MRRAVLPFALLALGAWSCDMDRQPRYDAGEHTSLFANGTSLQAPPEGTIARDDPQWQRDLQARPALTAALLQRGRERYAIFCAPCHDLAGFGHGTVPARGFPAPPSFHIARLREAPSSYLVQVITQGHGAMYSYAQRVPPADRWAIAAYIRALQLSQDTPIDRLSSEERNRLQGMAR